MNKYVELEEQLKEIRAEFYRLKDSVEFKKQYGENQRVAR